MAARKREAVAEVLPISRPDEKTLERIIRPELNIERWSIWQPSSSRAAPRPRIIIREVTLENGSKVTSKVKVHYTDEGALTTFDQRVYYALIRIWEEEGRSIGTTNFSLRRLARILKMSWGPSTHKALLSSLTRLHITPFSWEHAFFDKEKGETLRTTGNAFHILSELHIEQWEKGKAITREQARFRFGERILKNLYANYTRPVCLDAVLSINSEIGQLLYTHIDLKIYGEAKTKYVRNTKELFFGDLALEGKTYRYPSKRKEKIEPALKELCGLRISDGVISSATLEPTKDGKDYKIIIVKSPLGHQVPQYPPEADGDRGRAEDPDPMMTRRVERLIAAGFGRSAAIDLASTYPDETDRQLDALPSRNLSKVNDPVAWLRCAIEQGYALPPSPEQGSATKQEKAQKSAECPFCKDSVTPGMRRIVSEKYPNGAWKHCSHDPETESKYTPAE
jgi:hypothetical protein